MNPTSMQFRLYLTCDDDAFGEAPAWEIARILRETAARLEAGDDFDTYRNLLDANGNVAGTAALKTVDEHENGRRHVGGARGGPVFHMTRDAVTTLCGLPAAGAIHAHYGGQELDRGTWCEECRAARKGAR